MIKNIPITFQNTGLSAEDQEQLSILYENASRKLLDILSQRLGKAGAEAFKIYITNTDPVPAVLEEKTATPATTQVVVTPSSGKDGMSKVTVSAVTAAIDENIVAENIKKDVVILGITGTYEAS